MDTEAMTLDVAGWVGDRAVDLADLRGRVVLIEVFQMLCPGCVSHGIPQALRVHRTLDREQVTVIGLHSVFEHHDVMGPDALEAFVFEYKIGFPVAIDRPVEGRSIPATMARYGLQGTPTTLLVDRSGRLRHSILGSLDDLTLGSHIGRLVTETPPPLRTHDAPADEPGGICRPGSDCS